MFLLGVIPPILPNWLSCKCQAHNPLAALLLSFFCFVIALFTVKCLVDNYNLSNETRLERLISLFLIGLGILLALFFGALFIISCKEVF